MSSASSRFRVGVNGGHSITVVTTGCWWWELGIEEKCAPIGTELRSTGTLPPGVTFTDLGHGRALLEGTPAAGTAGRYAITFTAGVGGVGPFATQSFTLIVD
jgi:hypothetical protein